MSANDPASRAAAAARGCFHCGLPVPAGTLFSHASGGEWRVFCCPGCEAVSQSISGLGLDGYYRLRASPAPRPSDEPDAELAIFDDELVQERFVREVPRRGDDPAEPRLVEAQLMLEGLRCSACAWLIEQVVAPGDAFDAVKLLDMLMLVLFGAQERTAEEYRSLLEGARFRDVTVVPTPTIWNVIEAVRE